MKKDLIGQKTARLMKALDGRRLTSLQFQIIAHPEHNDRSNYQAELDKLHSRGFTHMELVNGEYLHTLSPKGQRILAEYQSK